MSIAEALQAVRPLGIARLDAQLLLLHALGRADDSRAWLLAHDADELPAAALEAFSALCRRRATGEPLAYLTGEKEFFGLPLRVDARVLVPRPETETLVDWALEILARHRGASGCHAGPEPASMQRPGEPPWIPGPARDDKPNSGTLPSVIDLGTGSGAIALAIKRAWPAARVEAVDNSAEALDVARANAQRLGLDVDFRQARWFAGATHRYDLVVSNPPYVADADPHLPALANEPRDALVAGIDGLDALRSIIEQAPSCLLPGGWLLVEHGYDQAGAVRALLEHGGFAEIATRRDLAGIERCSGGKRRALG